MASDDVAISTLGTEREKLAIVENFHPFPDRLRAFAGTASFEPALHHYPGRRANLPADYIERVMPVLTSVLRDVFGYRSDPKVIDASFAIVTTPPEQLAMAQRLPHADAHDIDRVALVHYLSLASGGGTAFFRHRASGYEKITAARARRYYPWLESELAGGPQPAGYIRDSDPYFERIALVEARYNRAVLYRSAMLHSGAIAPGATLDPDPATGRLTITAFLAP